MKPLSYQEVYTLTVSSLLVCNLIVHNRETRLTTVTLLQALSHMRQDHSAERQAKTLQKSLLLFKFMLPLSISNGISAAFTPLNLQHFCREYLSAT